MSEGPELSWATQYTDANHKHNYDYSDFFGGLNEVPQQQHMRSAVHNPFADNEPQECNSFEHCQNGQSTENDFMSLVVNEQRQQKHYQQEPQQQHIITPNSSTTELALESDTIHNAPRSNTTNVQEPSSPQSSTVSSNEFILHNISHTDTLQGICLKYRISSRDLRKANRGFSGSNLSFAPNPLLIPIKREVKKTVIDIEPLVAQFLEKFESSANFGRYEVESYLKMSRFDLDEAIKMAKMDLSWSPDKEDVEPGRYV